MTASLREGVLNPKPAGYFERMSLRPPRLHAVDGMRVIAEFLVVRHHVTEHTSDGEWYAGVDLMSLFFVLSGFSVMYTYEREDFSSWTKVVRFWRKRLIPVYVVHLIHWLCWFPDVVERQEDGCFSTRACPLLQLGWLDSWAGCGMDVPNFPSWYLSCQVWFWAAFPLIRDTLVERLYNQHNMWSKMGALHAVSTGIFLACWHVSIITVIGFPPARFLEFAIGAGAALALHTQPPALLQGGRYWFPLAWTVAVYVAGMLNHTVTSFCLHESLERNCSLWDRPSLLTHPATAPCNTWADKVQSKSALFLAATIHGVARAELDGTGGWPVRFLSSAPFRELSKISLNLYLGHINMCMLVDWLGQNLLGIAKEDWNSDTKLFWIYLLCYWLHWLMVGVCERCQAEEPGTSQETEMLVIPPAPALEDAENARGET